MDLVQERSTKRYWFQVGFDQPHWPTSGGRRWKGRNDRRRKFNPDDDAMALAQCITILFLLLYLYGKRCFRCFIVK